MVSCLSNALAAFLCFSGSKRSLFMDMDVCVWAKLSFGAIGL